MKRELIRRIKSLPKVTSKQWPYEEMVELLDVLREIGQLDEPEKVVVPKFVADWIDDLKSKEINMLESIYEFPHGEDIHDYMREQGNVLMRAWLGGFTVEEEQKYYFKIGNLYLAEPLGDMTSDIVRMTRDKGVAYQFTDKKSIATHLDKFEGIEAVKVEETEE